MQEFPKGGIIGKTVHLWRRVVMLRIPLYAANASYFIVMALFPGLVLLLGLLQHTTPAVERLGEMLGMQVTVSDSPQDDAARGACIAASSDRMLQKLVQSGCVIEL